MTIQWTVKPKELDSNVLRSWTEVMSRSSLEQTCIVTFKFKKGANNLYMPNIAYCGSPCISVPGAKQVKLFIIECLVPGKKLNVSSLSVKYVFFPFVMKTSYSVLKCTMACLFYWYVLLQANAFFVTNAIFSKCFSLNETTFDLIYYNIITNFDN